MSNVDANVIAENLTELLQNSVNMTSVFYDIFLNPEPMDVQLKQFDNEGNLITVTIPNRAKDRNIALTGEVSPEGNVTANVGACYVDTVSETVYFKAVGNGNTGWVYVLTQESVNQYIRTYLADNNFVTRDDLNRYLLNNDYTTVNDVNTLLVSYKPTIPMIVRNATGTVALTDNSGYAITATGNISFTLPVVTNLTYLHKIFVQLNLPSAYTVSLGTSNYFDKIAPTFSSSGMYNIMYEYDNAREVWVVGAMIKGAAS